MRRLFNAAACIVLLIAAGLAVAGDTGTPPAKDGKEAAPEQAPAQPQNAPAEKPATAATPDTFHPSEEISEDRSVSFPIDI